MMKSKNILLMVGLAAFTLVNSQAFAFSEEDMMEGMSLSVEVNQTSVKSYKYDNANVNAEESMTEFDFFPENNAVEKHYVGDNTCPEPGHMMAEGICLTQFAQEVASL